jgi:hypothetical protein
MSREIEPEDPQSYYEDLKHNDPKKLYDLKKHELTHDKWLCIVPTNGNAVEVTNKDEINFTDDDDLVMAASGYIDPIGICVFRKGKDDIKAKRDHYITVIDGDKVYILGQFDPFCDHHYYTMPENDTYKQIISFLT